MMSLQIAAAELILKCKETSDQLQANASKLIGQHLFPQQDNAKATLFFS